MQKNNPNIVNINLKTNFYKKALIPPRNFVVLKLKTG